MATKKTKTKLASSPKSKKPVPKNTAPKSDKIRCTSCHLILPKHTEKCQFHPANKIEISVRTIYYDGQYLPALCFRHPDPPSAQAVIGDPVSGVRDIPLSVRDHDRSGAILHVGIPYPPERFANHMRIHAQRGVPVTPGARTLLLPLVPDMPALCALPGTIPVSPGIATDPGSVPRTNGSRPGVLRTSGKDLIYELSKKSNLPPEKVRAKLRAAGLKAPYLDSVACHKALGVK